MGPSCITKECRLAIRPREFGGEVEAELGMGDKTFSVGPSSEVMFAGPGFKSQFCSVQAM